MAKCRTFYSTDRDERIITEIQTLRPYYSFNFAVREALEMLLKELKRADQITPIPPGSK